MLVVEKTEIVSFRPDKKTLLVKQSDVFNLIIFLLIFSKQHFGSVKLLL